MEEQVRGLKDLLRVAQAVVSSLDLDEVLQNILGSAMGIMEMPAGSIALYDPKMEKLSLHAHDGLSRAFTGRQSWRVKEGGLSHHILSSGEPLSIEDTDRLSFNLDPVTRSEGIRSIVAVPLKVQDAIVGILYLDDFRPRAIDPERRGDLSILASFAAMSIANARLHKEMSRLAHTDGLTGLFNHRHFQEKLRVETARAARYGKPLSLVMFDIDDFKAFNDAHGHPSGDKALMIVAEILRDALRECDLLFRYGGEEFMAILPETSLHEALVAAERGRSALAEMSAERLAGMDFEGLTASVGVASFPRDARGPEELLRVVDGLLYRSKRGGKNRVNFIAKEFPPPIRNGRIKL
ncbi:sensor domain-containing diguanylate cyclase [uncultured Desulfuromonas sp.]|uniref:sensor domain-containing diguanylate cyclase n=1 Tax=uncultured Desulfuromonas sp. TaxID=181013 RepID=UPI00261C1B53|nr:sensor domain-containing diguanylate cyclase [uncultured Desulfuromonas sp.]